MTAGKQAQPSVSSSAEPAPHLRRILATLMLAATSFSLMQSMLVPALPALRDHLDASPGGIAWVLTGFLLSSSVLTPIVGRAGDLYGTQRLLVLVLAVFSVGTVVSALSVNLPEMLIGRVIQGVGAGVFPLAFGIVRSRFPAARVAGSIGAVSSVIGIGGGLGLVLPGVILTHLGIQWLFWIPLILNMLALAAVLAWAPRDRPQRDGRVNLLSATWMSIGLAGLLVTLNEASSWRWWAILTTATSLVFVALWIRRDLRHTHPLIAMSIMKIRTVWAANVTAILVGAAMFGSFLLVPLFTENPAGSGFGFRASVLLAGLIMIPTAIPQLILGAIAGTLDRAIGSRLCLILGCLLLVASFAVLAFASHTIAGVVVATTLIGAGLGLAIPALANVTVEAVPSSHVGAATAMSTVIRNIGGALGTQLSSTILVATWIPSAAIGVHYTIAFAILGVGAAIAAAVSLMVNNVRPKAGSDNRFLTMRRIRT
jgi:EmrB/QacA subfamily drug resistance transporter